MSGIALRYWRERLEDMCPYYKKVRLTQPQSTLYASEPVWWPMAINTVSLYEDFLDWWHDHYVSHLPDDCPPPRPPHNKQLFATLRDFLHIEGGKPRLHRVPVPRTYEGTRFTERKQQRFIFLKSWKDHVAVYETITQSSVQPKLLEKGRMATGSN